MNVIEKKLYVDGESYYFNTDTNEKYGEIVGGLAWPDSEDGFLVIAAVDLFENINLETRHIRILTEASECNMDAFLKRALELQKRFSPFMGTIKVYGDTGSLAMMEFLDQFNRNRRSRSLSPFYLTEAPQLREPTNIDFYAQLIKTYAQPGQDILHFCDTRLPCVLGSLSLEEVNRGVLSHPPIAALGYALAVLSTWKPRKGEKRQETGNTEVNSNASVL